MRLCDQCDTIGITTTCNYVSGECLCSNTRSCIVPSLTIRRHACGTWQLQPECEGVAEAQLTVNWSDYTWLKKALANGKNGTFLQGMVDMCYLNSSAIR
jgi:hypothetical protein